MAAGALLRDEDGRVLLVEPAYKDFWEIPGGAVEAGESPYAAVVRELAEELGLTVTGRPTSARPAWSAGEDWSQLLVRALLYRLGPTGIFAIRNRLQGNLVTHVQRVKPVVDAVLPASPARPAARPVPCA